MRLGSIRYINSLPVDLGFLSGKIPIPAQIIRGVPSDLNQQILYGRIDISPVSVYWYAKHQSEFLILPDISISSESGVQSVLLFSRVPAGQLKEEMIYVTGEGKTTPVLLEILCQKLYGFKPRLRALETPLKEIAPDIQAVLLIGDEALVTREKLKDSGWFITDLAEEWKRWTGLGFVFAVWAARREYMRQKPEEAHQIYEAILESKKWGLSHREAVIAEAYRQTALPEAILRAYFSCLSYELDDSLIRGMRLYFQYAADLGLLSEIKAPKFAGRLVKSGLGLL